MSVGFSLKLTPNKSGFDHDIQLHYDDQTHTAGQGEHTWLSHGYRSPVSLLHCVWIDWKDSQLLSQISAREKQNILDASVESTRKWP